MAFFAFIILSIERYPLLMYYKYLLSSEAKRYPPRGKKVKGFFKKTKLYLIDGETLYNLTYLAFTIAALFYPFFYTILLIDVIKRSNDLITVLRALQLNYKKLFKIGLLILIIVYSFSLLGMLEFRDDYEGVRKI